MKKLLSALIIILAGSCKSDDKNLITFNPNTITTSEISLSDIADSIQYIFLDNQYPLGHVSNIKITNNFIYLSAQNIGILLFERDGKFLHKVGSVGRGPGEYLFHSIFAVDESTGEIYVRDVSNDIKVFSRNGKFKRNFSGKEYGDYISSVDFFNSALFASYSVNYENSDYEWIAFDSLGKVIGKKDRKSVKFVSNASGPSGIYKHENLLTFWNNFSDTIFSILPDLKSRPSFIIQPGEHRIPRSRITAETMSQFMFLYQIFESRQFIILRYFYPQKKFELVLIDKNSKKIFQMDMKLDESGYDWIGGIKNDLDGGPTFLPVGYFVEKEIEYLLGFTNPIQTQALLNSDEFRNSTPKFPEKKNDLAKLSLKETDNPILMIVRLKNVKID